MKKFKYILPLLAILFIACDSNDDGFYNTIYIDTANLVQIEQLADYEVNDIIYVNALIPNLLSEPGEISLLNLRKTTGNADTFEFTYFLERQQNEEWLPVDVTTSYQSDAGQFNTGSFVQALPQYMAQEEAYIYRGGIKLLQTGNYRLSFGYNSTAVDKVELASNSRNNNITVKISSSTNQVDSNGYYNFTVN